jgi:hypothetical protein
MRGQVYDAATKAVEQWRARTSRLPTTNLERLLEHVAAAEEGRPGSLEVEGGRGVHGASTTAG